MTLTEKIALADQEVDQARIMVGSTRIQLIRWEQILDLRRETRALLVGPAVLSETTKDGKVVKDETDGK